MRYLGGHFLTSFFFQVSGELREPVASMERREIRYRGDEEYGGMWGLRGLGPKADPCT